jgi:hypothetical protein
MTTWTKVADIETDYEGGSSFDALLSEDSETFLMEGGDSIVGEGPITDFTKVADASTSWDSIGGLIILCTEGSRELLMTEARTDYLLYSHGVDRNIWTEVADQVTVYTKINDM